eukprot:5158308-Pleurochrysis_carterae.AAC.2
MLDAALPRAEVAICIASSARDSQQAHGSPRSFDIDDAGNTSLQPSGSNFVYLTEDRACNTISQRCCSKLRGEAPVQELPFPDVGLGVADNCGDSSSDGSAASLEEREVAADAIELRHLGAELLD